MNIRAISNNNISFQKTLVAKADVLKNNKPYLCKIYKLEETDKNYFKNLLSKQSYRFPDYLYDIDEEFDNFCDGYSYETDFYVLEDKKSKCLGILETSLIGIDGGKNIDYIETAYECSQENPIRTVKYVGETLLAFVGKLIKESNDECMDYVVGAPVCSARDFYTEHCGFEPKSSWGDFESDELMLPEYKIDDLIEQNEEHTKGKIELLL